MAYQPEIVQYDAGIYQLEVIDPVDGGVGAVSNKPLLSLANRTAYLYQHVNNLESGATIPPGIAVVNSQTFTGTPQAPTPAAGDNTTKLATTAFVQGAYNGRTSISVAGGTNVTLTAVQAGTGILTFTGALTANIAVIVPAANGQWVVENNTTGAFTLTVKTASGTGIAVTQGLNVELFCDGTNVQPSTNDYPSIALTGTPTAPTAAQFDNSTKIATTAFVQRALGSRSTLVGVSTTTTLTTAATGAFHVLNSSTVTTLPAASSFPAGGSIDFMSTVGSATVLCAGADTIQIGNTVGITSVVLNKGDSLTLVSNGIAWYAQGGSATLPYSIIMSGANWTTAAQFDNSTRLATTAFVQRALGNFQASLQINATSTLTAANSGTAYQITGAYTVTLPLFSTMTSGGVFSFSNNTASTATIQRNTGTDPTITYGASNAASISVGQGDTITIVAVGGIWLAFSGSVAVANSNAMSSRYAPLASPVLTGAPAAPTAAAGTNTTQLATTAFVNAIFAAPPAIGTTTRNSANFTSVAANAGATISGGATITGGVSVDTLTITSSGTVPTPAIGDNSTKLATTAFVQRSAGAFAGYTAYNANTTLTSAVANYAIQSYGGTITFTLPLGSTMTPGSTLTFYNHGAGVLTIATQGSDFIYDGVNVQPVALQIGDNLELVSRGGTEWDLVGGTAALQFVTGPVAKTATAGDSSTKIATTAFVATSFAPLASPALTGTPTAPTAATATNTTQIATTAFVKAQGYATLASPALTGTPTAPTATAGTSTTQVATTAFVAASFAPLASPALSGTPTAPTIAQFDNSTSIATTAFVRNELLGLGGSAYTSLFGGSIAASGYQKLPSGLIIQWGPVASTVGNGVTFFSFPIAFPNAVYALLVTGGATAPQTTAATLQGNVSSLSSAAAYNWGSTTIPQGSYLAIGK